jgi:hypothetical protein|tara:strand:+ start:1446 stop:1715 length:270 start_codon:yes stop_codon:yes gene_type:complete
MIRDSRLERIGKLIYQTWDERPDPPVWAKGGLKALGYEVAEEIIDLQFQAAYAITQGRAAGKNQYNPTEMQSVESLGFKFIYSPGGFVV